MTETMDQFIPEALQNERCFAFSIAELHDLHVRGDNEVEEPSTVPIRRSSVLKARPSSSLTVNDGMECVLEETNADLRDDKMYHLILAVNHCIFKTGNDSKLLFSIYDNSVGKQVTEEYCLHLTDNNFPIAGSTEDCKVLFKDLPLELLRHELWICVRIYRIGPVIAPDIVTTKSTSKKKKRSREMNVAVTRPFGAVVIHLSDHIEALMDAMGEEITFEPTSATLRCPVEEAHFPTMITEMIANQLGDGRRSTISKTRSFFTPPLSLGIAHGMTLFEGDANKCILRKLAREYPHYDALTTIDRLQIDLSLSTPRHILYLKLKDIHVSQRGKYAACNVGCKISLRHNETGKSIPGTVLMGKGLHVIPTKEAECPIYYHCNDPKVNQMYEVMIPSNLLELEQCHLYFSCFHFSSSKKPEERGFAFIKLYQDKLGQITPNRSHIELRLHKTESERKGTWYLKENQTRNEGKKSSIGISIQFCSTKIYSNADVHYLLTYTERRKLRKQIIESTEDGDDCLNTVIIEVVKRVQKQQFVTLLQVMDELLDAIFTIFLESKEEKLINQLYALLVFILSEANRNTNAHFKHRIEQWIETQFSYSKVWRTLIEQQTQLLEWITSDEVKQKKNTEKIRTLQHSMRGIRFLFDIMWNSKRIEIEELERNSVSTPPIPNSESKDDCESEAETNECTINDILCEYDRKIMGFFSSLNYVMKLSKPSFVAGVQSLALRHAVSLLDRIPEPVDASRESQSAKLTQIVLQFVQSISKKGINNSIDKLLLIRRCFSHPKLERNDILSLFMEPICDILNYHMGQTLDEKAICLTIMRKCVPFLYPNGCFSRGRKRGKGKRPLSPSSILKQVQFYEKKTNESLQESAKASPISSNPVPTKLCTAFSVLLIKAVGVLQEIRSCDLSEMQFAQKIFGKTFAKNPSTKNGEVIISKEQLFVHQHMVMTTVDIQRVLLNAKKKVHSDVDDERFSFDRECKSINDAVTLMMQKEPGSVVNVIENALQSCINLLEATVFPKSWIAMKMIKIELALRSFSWLYIPLERNYLSEDTFAVGLPLWRKWLKLGVLFLEDMEDLALEEMNSERLEFMESNYGDLRCIVIDKLTKAWDALTPHRAALADTMIKAAILASVSEVDEMQQFAKAVYFGMICSEFEATSSLNNVETHTIDLIDHLTAKYNHKEKVIGRYLDFFRIHVRNQLDHLVDDDGDDGDGDGHKTLQEMGHNFLNDIERLYGYFVRLNNPNDQTHEDRHVAAAMELLHYLDELKKHELYNRYMHKLGLYHKSLRNHTESAICFLRHSNRLGFSDRILAEETLVRLKSSPEWKRHIECLELSYKQFMIGECWEMAVSVCQLLAKAYEEEIFDIRALSSVLERQSQVWSLIETQDRVFHSAYLVRFIGTFGDSAVSGKSFVYKAGNGKFHESVRDFTKRIHSMYLHQGDGGKERKKKEEQRIEITTLNASSKQEMKGGAFKFDEGKYLRAPLRVKKYYRNNETDTFYSTAVMKNSKMGDNEFRHLWSKKMYVLCENVLPTVSRRVEVIQEEVVKFSPFQTAINNMEMANDKLKETIETLEKDLDKSTHEISMRLNGMLDAAVMGGINKYREAFFDGTYFRQNPKEIDLVEKFVEALKQQMAIAKEGLDSYENYAIEQLQPHVDRLRQCHKKQGVQLLEFYKETDRFTRDL